MYNNAIVPVSIMFYVRLILETPRNASPPLSGITGVAYCASCSFWLVLQKTLDPLFGCVTLIIVLCLGWNLFIRRHLPKHIFIPDLDSYLNVFNLDIPSILLLRLFNFRCSTGSIWILEIILYFVALIFLPRRFLKRHVYASCLPCSYHT